jgi:hypothetical protein
MRCASVRKKGALDQCQAKAVLGHTLCGRHAKCKTPVLWTEAHRPRIAPLIRFQAIVRGRLIRSRLALAGPGVLRRAGLANDEDLVSATSKERQDPFDYIAFEEGGKTWWFAFDTLWTWAIRSPINPYTRTPLSPDTRTRLWAIWSHRSRTREALPEEPKAADERLVARWVLLCRLFEDNGFVDLHPDQFRSFVKADYLSMFILLKRDLLGVLPPWDPARARALQLCERGIRLAYRLCPILYRLQSTYILMLLLTLHANPYVMVFSILSALYRC